MPRWRTRRPSPGSRVLRRGRYDWDGAPVRSADTIAVHDGLAGEKT
jgi:hypothetical protein